jgi:hypothetical protein
VEKPELKGKGGGGLDIHMPKFGFGGSGKGNGDIDARLLSGDVDIHPPGADISGGVNVKAPKVNVDVERPEVKGKGGGVLDIHMPKFGFGGSGKGKGEIDASLPSGALSGDVDVRPFGADVSGGVDVKGPKGDFVVDKPELRGKGKGGLDVHLPTWGFGGSGNSKADIDANLPSLGGSGGVDIRPPDADVSGSVSVKAPKVDIDMKKPEVKGKDKGGLDFHMPKFGFGSSGKGQGDISASLPSGGVSGGVDVRPPDADISGGVGVKAPKVDVGIEKPEFKGKGGGGLDMHLPTFGFGGNGKGMGDVDASLPSGGMAGGVDISPADANISGGVNVKGPKVDMDVDKPELKGKGKGGLDIHLPKFGFGGSHKGKGEVSASLASGGVSSDVDIRPPDADISGGLKVEGPRLKTEAHKVEVDLGKKGKPKGKSEGIMKLELPTFVRKSEVEADLEAGGTAYVESDVASPSGEGSFSGGTDIQFQSPHAEIDVRPEKRSLGKRMKGLFSSKDNKRSSMPKSPDPQADVNLSLPEAAIGVDVHGDIDVGGSTEMGVDIPSPKGKAPGGAVGNTELPSARVSASGKHSPDSVQRRSVQPAVSPPSSQVGIRPHSSVEGDIHVRAPRLSSTSSSSSECQSPPVGTDSRFGISVNLGGTGGKKSKKQKSKRSVETALRMGLPTVSVAAGNFDNSPTKSVSTATPKESHSADGEKNNNAQSAAASI